MNATVTWWPPHRVRVCIAGTMCSEKWHRAVLGPKGAQWLCLRTASWACGGIGPSVRPHVVAARWRGNEPWQHSLPAAAIPARGLSLSSRLATRLPARVMAAKIASGSSGQSGVLAQDVGTRSIAPGASRQCPMHAENRASLGVPRRWPIALVVAMGCFSARGQTGRASSAVNAASIPKLGPVLWPFDETGQRSTYFWHLKRYAVLVLSSTTALAHTTMRAGHAHQSIANLELGLIGRS